MIASGIRTAWGRVPMLEASLADERARAIKTRDNLLRLIGKLQRGENAQPSELTTRLRGCGQGIVGLFHLMACDAVSDKYRRGGKSEIADKLTSLRAERAQLIGAGGFVAWSNRQRLEPLARPLQALSNGHNRIAVHQTRWKACDLDIVLCADLSFGLDLGVTPWVCQQPDLRYRWTDAGMVRLKYLAACWDAYAECSLSAADQQIGLHDFPVHPDYC
jgi:hypothetical protein